LSQIEKANPDPRDQGRQLQHMYMNTRGAVLYRAGRFEEAAPVLREGIRIDLDALEFHGWAFLALAEHRLGHADWAKQAAATARVAMAKARPETA
jgi:hypothetical protein